MGEEAYQITDYVHDEVVAFCGAMNPKGKLKHSEDEMYSTERLKLEGYNPEDTIPVATFFYEKYPPKKSIFLCRSIYRTTLGSKSSRSIFALCYSVG